MFNENAELGKFLRLYPSYLDFKSQHVLNGGRTRDLIPERLGVTSLDLSHRNSNPKIDICMF